MKNLVKSVIIALYFGFLMVEPTHGQDLLDFLEVSQQEDEGMILPQYDYEYIPDFTYDQVKARIEAMDTEMPFELNETIFSFIHYFTVRNRGYARMILERKDTYLPLFEEALARHHMPDDIKYLSIIESGLNPRARSRVGAMGLWQFMPATGREYKLYVNQHMDDRMDPELATEAAVRYLKALHRMFGDWEVALAAYNCGPGNVRRAIRRSGGKKTFWGIYNHLPRETRSYVPQFQAMMYVLRHVEEHNLILEEPSFPIPYETVQFNHEVDLERLAELSGICIEDIEELNPSVLRRRIPASHKHYALKVPKANAEFLAENMEWISDSVSSAYNPNRLVATVENPNTEDGEKITYRVRSGDALGTIARRHNVTVADLRNWNGLYSNLIRVGQQLSIYTDSPQQFDQNLASTSPNDNPSNSRVYTVQPGDSLWLISRKVDGVTIDQIKKLNNLNNNQIKPGQKLIIG